MAPGKKTGGKDFVKGDPRCGRKPLPFAVRKVLDLTRETMAQDLHDCSNLTIKELQIIVNAEDEPALKVAMANALLYLAKSGRYYELDLFFDRTIGTKPLVFEGSVKHKHYKITDAKDRPKKMKK